MSTPDSVVIVGGGMAGANAAFTLRKLGYEGRVAIVSAESELPYERPPLSKDYLRGETPLDKAYVRPAPDYEAEGVELLSGRTATAIDLSKRQVEPRRWRFASVRRAGAGDRIGAAHGGPAGHRPVGRPLPSDGRRRRPDQVGRRRAAKSATVVGGGWIGTEVAASLRQLGLEVTLISRTPRPLERVLGPEIADVYRQLHEEHGVRILAGSAGDAPLDDD